MYDEHRGYQKAANNSMPDKEWVKHMKAQSHHEELSVAAERQPPNEKTFIAMWSEKYQMQST
jgi:hypothetical protein